MKAKLKYLTLFLLSLCIILSCPLSIIAKNNEIQLVSTIEQSEFTQKEFKNNGELVSVIIPNELNGKISDKEIKEIILSHELDSNNVLTIHDIVENNTASNSITKDNENTQTREILSPYIYKTYKTNDGDETKDLSFFILSVAKGMQLTLQKDFEKTLNSSLLTGTPFASFDLGGSLTARYSTTVVFQGPPESSSYNSRSYYVRFFSQKYNWIQERYLYFMLEMTTTGTGKTPTRYTMYSIDSYESN